ncbi:hypothetical protein GB931_03625 [Modestobacter sp. I12A-02628]|uniref:PPE family protein n=1 Tax=Goekera deserti TaxID=2497753 RepID=A0A7K3WCN0_9ACTN|nr:hypothetical protein [Goekera deserti]MPQ97028.1 hypothetical protein [Goekera deserti]NDI46656.1 hypothetical protein [Goekera deserti]NEL54225.1 hypothetical protein [Goekera deserti]
MPQYAFEDAYARLMSPAPQQQAVSSTSWRNLAAAARLQAEQLRSQGSTVNQDAGTSGVAAQEQAEVRAAWFVAVAEGAEDLAGRIDHVVQVGLQSQTSAEAARAIADQAAQQLSAPDVTAAQEQAYLRARENGASRMSTAVDQWSTAYDGLAAPTPPPAPGTPGAGSPASAPAAPYAGGADSGYRGAVDGLPAPAGPGPTGGAPAVGVVGDGPRPTGTVGTGDGGGAQPAPALAPVPIQPGAPGSITVGADGGDFAGWFRDPTSGFYVDPSTGREFDPATSRWVDPVTGRPFGEATQYATRLEGVGGASLTGGLLGDGATGVGGAGWSRMFAGGAGTGGLAAGYGGFLPPSLAASSPAQGRAYATARDTMAVRSATASRMLAREDALRTGHPYAPPVQTAAGAGAGTARRTSRSTSDEALFSTASSRAAAARGGAPAAASLPAGAPAGRGAGSEPATARAGVRAGEPGGQQTRSWLPPTQAGGAADREAARRDRPDWLVEDDLWGTPPASPAVLDGSR